MSSNKNNSGWLADVVYIYPNKAKKYTFEDDLQAKQKAKVAELSLAKQHISNIDFNKGTKKLSGDPYELMKEEKFDLAVNETLRAQQRLAKKEQINIK